MTRTAHLANWGKPLAEAIVERVPGMTSTRFFEVFPLVMREFVMSGHLDQLSAANAAALDVLKHDGYELYAVTSRHLVELDHLMSPDHKLAGYLAAGHIFHRDNSTHLKPDPRAFDGVLQLAQLPSDQCLYVGDSVTDCQAAKGADMQFVACLESGLRSRADFAALTPPPDGYIDAFADLPSWLKKTELIIL